MTEDRVRAAPASATTAATSSTANKVSLVLVVLVGFLNERCVLQSAEQKLTRTLKRRHDEVNHTHDGHADDDEVRQVYEFF